MIYYSTNWMGPISTRWYDERNIPFELRMTSGERFPKREYKDYLESYSCGRIDIRDDSKQGYDGWDEYGLAPMRTEDWNELSDWLDDLITTELWEYDMLISIFEGEVLGRKIRWANERI